MEAKEFPKVSIIIPYNTDRGFLTKAVNSVYDQTYPNIEMVISHSDENFSTNLNDGIRRSAGEFIRYLCEDDILPPDSIAKSIRSFSSPMDFIHGRSLSFDARSMANYIHIPNEKNPTLQSLLAFNHVANGSTIYRRRVFDLYGYFDPSLWTGEEYEFNLRILSMGANLGYCDDVLYYYRHHPLQKNLGNKDRKYQYKRMYAISQIRDKYLKP
jgi:glycosyltransferase involved in cell wall biosynthesis